MKSNTIYSEVILFLTFFGMDLCFLVGIKFELLKLHLFLLFIFLWKIFTFLPVMLLTVIFLIDSSSFSLSHWEEIEDDFKSSDVLPHNSGSSAPDHLLDTLDICQSTSFIVLWMAVVMVEVEDVESEVSEDYNNINYNSEEKQALIELGSVFVQHLERFEPPHS